MKITEVNNIITFFLEDRISVNNAPEIEKEIFGAIEGKDAEIIIDAEKLEYISSAGLRVLMRLAHRKDDDLKIINVSRDVYDILETTGFTEMFDVHKAFRKVSVEGCEEIGSGGYGTVYRLDEETIIKVYTRSSLDVIESERLMSQRAFVNKLPTAIPYDIVQVGDKYGVIYEMLDAKTVAQHIDADPENLEKYVRPYAAALRDFHKIELSDELFKDKKLIFYNTADIVAPYLTDEENAEIKEFLDSIPERRTFIHGDYNAKNVMLDDGRIMLIDIGDAGVGHPVFDLAGVWLYCFYTKKAQLPPEEIRRLMGFDTGLSEQVWDAFSKEYFQTEDPERLAEINRKLMPLALFTVAYHGIRRTAVPDEDAMQKRVEYLIRRSLLPAIRSGERIDF